MSGLLVLQQQKVPAAVETTSLTTTPLPGACWQFWPLETIASVSQCPATYIATNWVAIHSALDQKGVANKSVCAGAIGTIAVETASTFQPVREAFWLSDAWRQANLRYYPWYGRGFIQLTWQSNYATYGTAINVDLLANPDLAMDPATAAKIFAEFFVQSGAAAAAARNDWAECRRHVQGGSAGLDRLISIVKQLGLPAG